MTLPGLIDPHVHFREPGLTHKGDMESEAAAAITGGVTTVCDMPNTVPPTTSIAAFAEKIERAKRLNDIPVYRYFDLRFFFGITEQSHIEELKRLWANPVLRARCCGVKLYLDHSTGNQRAEGTVVEKVFKVCAKLDCLVVAHCEDAAMNEKSRMRNREADVSAHSKMRPPESEVKSINDALVLVRSHGTRFHVAHLSTRGGLDAVRGAKKEGLPVTCEVAPHHLFLTVEDYETLGTFGKMNPPLRSAEHQKALWEGIMDGAVDCIATDHAPHTREEKLVDDPLAAPSGVPGVATMLPLLLTVATGKWPGPTPSAISYQLSVADIERLCFTNPNRIFRLNKDPDAVRIEIDPETEWTIRGRELPGKCQWTPYEGWAVRGKIVRMACRP